MREAIPIGVLDAAPIIEGASPADAAVGPDAPAFVPDDLEFLRDVVALDPTPPVVSADRRYLAVLSERRLTLPGARAVVSLLVFDVEPGPTLEVRQPLETLPLVTPEDWADPTGPDAIHARVRARVAAASKRLEVLGFQGGEQLSNVSTVDDRRSGLVQIWKLGTFTVEAHDVGARFEIRRRNRRTMKVDVPAVDDWDQCSRELEHQVLASKHLRYWLIFTQPWRSLDLCTGPSPRIWLLAIPR